MAMIWQAVSAEETTIPEIVQCFKNVSSDSRTLTDVALNTRLRKRINETLLKPHLFGAPDTELEMFKLYRYFDDTNGENRTLLTLALDRTLHRTLVKRAPTGRPRRNHWCITLGIADNNTLDRGQTSAAVLDLLKTLSKTMNLALLWKARNEDASDDLSNDQNWDNLKLKGDIIFRDLRAVASFPWYTPEDAPLEYSYAHWAKHLDPSGITSPPIRFVPVIFKSA